MKFSPLSICQDLWVTFENPKTGTKTHSLRGINVALTEGEMFSVVGPSGSGKSTLLHTLAGFQKPTRGSVALLGTNITTLSPSKIAHLPREGVGFIFQSYNLIESLTALENVLLSARFGHSPLDKNRAAYILDSLGMGHRINHRVADLSGGEQQRVAVARVIYNKPRIIFADEPTGALDSESSAAVIGTLKHLAHQGSSVFLVTHDLEEAAKADSCLILRDGIVQNHLVSPSQDQLWNIMKQGLAHV